LENGVDEIEFVGDDILTLLEEYIDNPKPPYRVKEIMWPEENAISYGYVRVGNSWVLRTP